MTAPMPLPRWILDKGGEARVLETDGDRVTLEATRAFPPGAPLVAYSDGSSETYRIKVKACRRTPDDTLFRIEGRFVNLSREQRERLMGRQP